MSEGLNEKALVCKRHGGLPVDRVSGGCEVCIKEAKLPDEVLFECQNCGVAVYEDRVIPLTEVPGLGERLDPGAVVPAGEHKDCGALVYLIKNPKGR